MGWEEGRSHSGNKWLGKKAESAVIENAPTDSRVDRKSALARFRRLSSSASYIRKETARLNNPT